MYAMKMVEADRDAALHASFTQEERLATGRHVHLQNNVLTFGCLVEGALDPGRLRHAFLTLQQRHESLRLVFPEQPNGTGGTAELRPPRDTSFHVEQVTSDAPDAGLRQAQALVAEAAAAPFDLATGPLVRLLCVRITPVLHLVGCVVDHIVVDGESCTVMAEELFKLYSADGPDATNLPSVRTQFPDFAHSERLHLQGRTLDTLLAYWRRKLDGVGAIPRSHLRDLATDDGRRPAPERRLLVRRAVIEEPRTTRLRDATRLRRATLTAVFAAALKDIVRQRRLSLGMTAEQAGDVAVMGSISNRHRRDIRHCVGYFATPCVLRTDLRDAPPFTEAVRRETGTLLGTLRHQEVPHALMTRELDSERYGVRHRDDPAAVPGYVNFDVSEAGAAWAFTDGALRVTMIRIPRDEVPRGGVRLLVRDEGARVVVELRTDASRFGPRWAEAFLADYMSLVETFTEQPVP